MDGKYEKRLNEWALFKLKLENRPRKPPFFKEGEIWWCYIGENIGIELSGKNKEFTRPAFVLKKYDKYSFLGLPLTTKHKVGSWYVSIKFNNVIQMVILAQSKTMDYRRLKKKVGELDSNEQKNIINAYSNLHIKIDPPQLSAEVVGKSQIDLNDSRIILEVKNGGVEKGRAK